MLMDAHWQTHVSQIKVDNIYMKRVDCITVILLVSQNVSPEIEFCTSSFRTTVINIALLHYLGFNAW